MSHFSPADDLLHDISGRRFGRESLFWVLPAPDAGMLAMLYAWIDADTGKWGRIVGLTDHFGGTPSYDAITGDLAFEGSDLDDFTVGGLHVRQPEPLRSCELSYSDGDFAVDCRMTALHEPFSWQDGPDGCPSWAADDRYEQSMRTEGTITVAGRTAQLSGFGHRDHSWGARDWRPLQHWKWMNAGTRDGELTFHGWISFALGERQINGYVNRGGTVSPIVEAEAHSRLDDEFLHTDVEGRFVTADGNELTWQAKGVAAMPLIARHIQMNEVACTATLEGRDAIAHIEQGWPKAYVEDYVNG